MENFALAGIVENLKPLMVDGIIRRVLQHQPNGFIFQTRSAKLPAFKIVADTRQPAVYASEARLQMDTPATDFLMVLRKHLTSAELISFHKPMSERVIELEFKTAVPSRELERMWLVVELLPNAPNIILLDAERRVLSSFLPITPQHEIGEYDIYKFPSAGAKIDLERVLSEDLPELDEFATQSDPKAWLISMIAGIGPIFAGEIVHRQKRSGRPVIQELRSLMELVRAPSHGGWLYTDVPLGHILERNEVQRLNKAVLSPIELESMERTHSSKSFANILEAARFYFDEIESRMLLEQAKMPVLRDLRDAAKRLNDRSKKLQREQQKYQEAENLHKTAQMLTSSGMKMDQHYPSISVTDYFSETPQVLKVELDSTMSLRENIDRMFKRHVKAERGKQVIVHQISGLRTRQARVEEQMRRIQAIRDWDTWLAISTQIEKHRGSEPSETPLKEPQLRRFRSMEINGREVLVGRSGRENDELTFHVAAPDDFWLHVAEYTGSHVVVRNPGRERDLDPEVLTKAAQLAAYFSQARNSSKVEVHYTRRKHVTKPKRAKAGMVRLLEFKSISVEPKNWLTE